MTSKQQVILGPRDLALVMRLRNGAEAPGGTSKETASEAADRIIELCSQIPALADALRSLLAKLDNLTTEEFSRGGEKVERERAAAVLAAIGETGK